MSAPTPAQPIDPNGVFIRAKDFPGEGWEWIDPSDGPGATWMWRCAPNCDDTIIEARPIPEPTIDVRLTVADVELWAGGIDRLDSLRGRTAAACREALSREEEDG